MRIHSIITLGIAVSGLLGCAGEISDIGRAPAMSAVGSGLAGPDLDILPSISPSRPAHSGASLWTSQFGNLYSDQRAARTGDILTINISINDKAQIGNSTDRSKTSKLEGTLNYATKLLGRDAIGAASADLMSTSLTNGKGAINRSERIQLSIAGVVKNELPNGTLYIMGRQEIRVNYELRVLEIAGLIRRGDITRDNNIAYDKIAEARVSYGGRGRIMEVQQPSTIHQIFDNMKPI